MPTSRLFLFFIFPQIILLIIFGAFPIFSQEYSYRHYTVKDGLVQNQVMTMFQDSKGYLWLGTKGGVSRFDGLKFQNYTVNDGLISNDIFRIFEDSKGGIYFWSLIGTVRLYKGKISQVSEIEVKYSDKENTIKPVSNQTKLSSIYPMIYPVYDGIYDSALIHTLLSMKNIQVQTIIKEDSFNKYWIIDRNDKLYFYKNDSLSLFSNNFNGRIIKDKNGKVYASADRTVFQIDTVNFQLTELFTVDRDKTTLLHDFDFDNKAYFISDQKKIIVSNLAETVEYEKKFNFINKLFVCKDNNLWIATETGFYRRISTAFENFNSNTGLNEYVWSIVEDDNQNIWFASYGDGLCIWDGKSIKKVINHRKAYSVENGNYFYTGAILASNQNIYFPVSRLGILEYNGRKFSLIPDIPAGSVLDVYEDTLNKRLLAASTRGLIIMDDFKSPVVHNEEFMGSGKYVKTIAQDKYGKYWLGGEYILAIFDGDKFIEFPNKKYNYNHGAVSIFKDHRDNIWLGTTAGLYFYNYKEFTKVAKNTLISKVASFVELDTTNLIMGISEGMAILDLEEFYENEQESIEIYDASKGFLGFDCIRNGMLKDSENNIWLATSDRVVKFYPDKITLDTLEPKIVIQQLKAIGSEPEHTSIKSIDNLGDSLINLDHYQKNIRIDFHALHFYAPEKIQYKYRLLGYENNWSPTSSDRYASYTNLSPGKYTFEVIAQNIDGVWSKQAAVVSIQIIPALWQTLSFRILINILILIITVSILYIILNYRRNRKKQKQQTEKQISELQLKTIRSQMDPHFTFNALNSISSVIYKEDKEKAYRYFTKFSKLVRSSLEVSDKITRSLEEEIDFTKNYLDLEKIRFRDQFEFSIHIDKNVNIGTKVPKMILHNYAENAVKHGLKHKEGSRSLKIEIFYHDQILNISIKDNGVGRKQAKALNEFSTGKGLEIMNNIYDLYFKLYKVRIEQEIEDLVDEQGKVTGTRVILKIPVLN